MAKQNDVIRATAEPKAIESGRLLEPEEYCRLLLSRRRLVRLSSSSTHTYLRDEASGEIVKVDEAQLNRYFERNRSSDTSLPESHR